MSFGQGEGTAGSRPRAWPWVVLLVALVLAGGFYWKWQAQRISTNPDAYQAVFLDNGQTYFGKLSRPVGKIVLLSDVYYFDFRSGTLDQAADTASDMKLLRLGSEIHGPESSMQINTEHILYTEDLRSDSKVVEAIVEAKAKQP